MEVVAAKDLSYTRLKQRGFIHYKQCRVIQKLNVKQEITSML